MKDKLFKKRHKVDWYDVLLEYGSSEEHGYFNVLRSKKSKVSHNRAAFATLRHFRGDLACKRFRATGLWQL